MRDSGKNSISSLAAFQLVMGDMLYEQVMKPRYAPCKTSAGPFEKTFMGKLSIFMNLKTDNQFNSLSNAVLEPIADMQKCDELLVQRPSADPRRNN